MVEAAQLFEDKGPSSDPHQFDNLKNQLNGMTRVLRHWMDNQFPCDCDSCTSFFLSRDSNLDRLS